MIRLWLRAFGLEVFSFGASTEDEPEYPDFIATGGEFELAPPETEYEYEDRGGFGFHE